jgi:hypothetical protein
MIMAVTTPPRSGPSCEFDSCVTYPYTDIAEYFPRDYYWMVPATLLLVPYLVLMAVICVQATADRKVFGLTGLVFASMAAVVLICTYFVQLTVVQPSLDRGETDGLSLISQYNPHGLFIAAESAGYTLMAFGFASIALAIAPNDKYMRALRWTLQISFALTVGAFVALISIYGNRLEYRFEIAVISIVWVTLIISGILLSITYAQQRRDWEGLRAAEASH